MMFQLIGGTCGAILIFGMPGGLLMGYARQKHGRPQLQRQHSGQQQQQQEEEEGQQGEQQQQQATLLAPADPELGPLQGDEAALEQHEGAAGGKLAAAPRVFKPGWLASKLWWAGVALVLLTAALCAYSISSLLVAGPG